jgi:type II secretory pathway predicted ATPase ExeA
MYEHYYQLKTNPFHTVQGPEFFYLSPKHRNALTYLEYGLMERSGFILLTGEIGTGKTTLIKYITEMTESEIEAAIIFNANVSSEQLLNLILSEFEIGPCNGGKDQRLDSLYLFLIEKFAQDKSMLLIIDEAHNLSREALEEVRMLSNLQSDDQMLLQIMLVGRPELKSRLRSPDLAQLNQRITVSCNLSALNREETFAYIAFRLEKAGGEPNLFTNEAVDLIYEASRGIPRIINIICDMALVYGFADDLAIIDVPVIEQVLDNRQGMGLEVQTVEPNLYGATKEGDGELLERLENLETRINKLQIQMDIRLGKLEKFTESYKDELVRRFKGLCMIEQGKNVNLRIEYSKLKEIYLVQKQELMEKIPAEQEAQKSTCDELSKKMSPVVDGNKNNKNHRPISIIMTMAILAISSIDSLFYFITKPISFSSVPSLCLLVSFTMALISLILLLRYPLLGRWYTIIFQTFLVVSALLYGIVRLLINTPLEGIKMLSFSAILIIWLYIFAFSKSSKKYFDYHRQKKRNPFSPLSGKRQ